MKRKRISPAVRRQEELLRKRVLQASLPFEKKLESQRNKLIKAILSQLKDYPQSEWEQYIASAINEPYLKQWYKKLYMQVGTLTGEQAIRRFINIKSDLNSWEQALMDWIEQETGNKITLVSGTLENWLIDTITSVMQEYPNYGVEYITQEVMKQWVGVKEWQIRRIVQTESLTAMSEASDVAVKSLNIPFNKTWGISGNNTRPAHLAMNGVTVGQKDMFEVNGELLEFPRDTKHGASAGNIINCACFCIRTPVNAYGREMTDEDILNLV